MSEELRGQYLIKTVLGTRERSGAPEDIRHAEIRMMDACKALERYYTGNNWNAAEAYALLSKKGELRRYAALYRMHLEDSLFTSVRERLAQRLAGTVTDSGGGGDPVDAGGEDISEVPVGGLQPKQADALMASRDPEMVTLTEAADMLGLPKGNRGHRIETVKRHYAHRLRKHDVPGYRAVTIEHHAGGAGSLQNLDGAACRV